MAEIYNLEAGSGLVEGLLDIARRKRIATAAVMAIGGVDRLRLAYFNSKEKKYEEHDYEEFLEVISLTGNVAQKDGAPFLHLHGTFAKRDMSVIGGHVFSGTVSPLLEAVFVPTANTAYRRFDESRGITSIYKIQQSRAGGRSKARRRRGSV